MRFTKKQVKQRAARIRRDYRAGLLLPQQIRQYESLPNWSWDIEPRRSVQEWVSIATQLAKDHGNELPNMKWLRARSDYSGLEQVMRKHPEHFSHLIQKQLRRTPDEQVKIAEALAKGNGGVLPKHSWLAKHHPALRSSLSMHPELFKHIPKPKPGKTTCGEWVAIAETVAKKHGGTFPNQGWLLKNGFRALREMMRLRPECFQHLPREKCFRTAQEWVVVAKELARRHGGLLPNRSWLGRNGYTGLDQCMSKYPRAFRHIKQLKLDSWGRAIR